MTIAVGTSVNINVIVRVAGTFVDINVIVCGAVGTSVYMNVIVCVTVRSAITAHPVTESLQ